MHHNSPTQRMMYRALKASAPALALNAIYARERQRLLTIKAIPRGWPAVLKITRIGTDQLCAWCPVHATVDGAAMQ